MENESKNLVKKQTGRPTVISQDTVAKLVEVFKLGASDEIACNYAEIHPATFYRHLENDDYFARKIRTAKNYMRIKAGQVVTQAILEKKDVQSARWWLEKKHPDEFGGKQDTSIQSQVDVKAVIQRWIRGEGFTEKV